MYVDSINGYIKACRDITSHIKSINNRLRGENKEEMSKKEEQAIRNQAKNDPLSHLILVVDEFTELKRFSSENNDIDFTVRYNACTCRQKPWISHHLDFSEH